MISKWDFKRRVKLRVSLLIIGKYEPEGCFPPVFIWIRYPYKNKEAGISFLTPANNHRCNTSPSVVSRLKALIRGLPVLIFLL